MTAEKEEQMVKLYHSFMAKPQQGNRIKPALVEQLRELANGESGARLAVLLRLAITLNRSRDPQPLPPFQITAAGQAVQLRFGPEWLEKRPLTRADLSNEREYLRAAGFELSFE